MTTTTFTAAVSKDYTNPNNWSAGLPSANVPGVINSFVDAQVPAFTSLSASIDVNYGTIEFLGNATYTGSGAISDTTAGGFSVIKVDAQSVANTSTFFASGSGISQTFSIAAGATLENANQIYSRQGAYIRIDGGIFADDSLAYAVDAGSKLIIQSSLTSHGTVEVGNSATVELSGSDAASVTTAFADLSGDYLTTAPVGGALVLDAPTLDASPISGFFNPAYSIRLVGAYSGAFNKHLIFSETGGVASVTVTTDTQSGQGGVVATLTFMDAAGRYAAANAATGGFSLATTGADIIVTNSVVACFAAGTRIATADGEVAVQDLQVGDLVVSAFGGTVPVVWLGHRHIDCARHANPQAVWPVRVRSGAFGAGLPRHDLLLSPDHAIHVDGCLIPARCLVNGRSIVQEKVSEVVYWHVELPTHDVVLAEGLPAESYLDVGNRSAFANGGDALVLHPDFGQLVWEAEACAPQITHGPILQAVLARVLAHMAASSDPAGRMDRPRAAAG